MSASLPPGNRNPSRRNSILGLAVVGVVFLAALVALSIWAVKNFVIAKDEVVIIPMTTAPQPAANPANAAARATPLAGQVTSQQRLATAIAAARPTFSGKVVDAQTHQPVNGVIAMLALSQAANQPMIYVNTAPSGQVSNGQYQLASNQMARANSQWYVRVQAHGYEAAMSTAQTGSATVDFELKPAKDITGIVYGVDGKPAADVTVAVALPGGASSVTINNGKISARSGLQVQSGGDGSYSLWPENRDFTVVAANSKGMALVSGDEMAKSTDVHLSAWGGVQGQVLYGTKPGAGASVYLSASPQNGAGNFSLLGVQVVQLAKADADGHFTLEFAMPGRDQLARRIEQKSIGAAGLRTANITSINYTQSTLITIEAGKTITQNIGGGGRPVVGKFILPTSPANAQYFITARITGQADVPVLAVMPDAVKSGTPAERTAWLQTFAQTPEGRDYLISHQADIASPKIYAPEIADDGSFRIEDMQPGDYRMQVTMQALTGGGGARSVQTNITMPPITPDLVDQPLEIPDIKVR